MWKFSYAHAKKSTFWGIGCITSPKWSVLHPSCGSTGAAPVYNYRISNWSFLDSVAEICRTIGGGLIIIHHYHNHLSLRDCYLRPIVHRQLPHMLARQRNGRQILLPMIGHWNKHELVQYRHLSKMKLSLIIRILESTRFFLRNRFERY